RQLGERLDTRETAFALAVDEDGARFATDVEVVDRAVPLQSFPEPRRLFPEAFSEIVVVMGMRRCLTVLVVVVALSIRRGSLRILGHSVSSLRNCACHRGAVVQSAHLARGGTLGSAESFRQRRPDLVTCPTHRAIRAAPGATSPQHRRNKSA